MEKTKNVLLVYPGVYGHPVPELPLSIIYLGGALRNAGFNPILHDMRIQQFQDISSIDFLAVGISAMTGNQIINGLKIISRIKQRQPKVPIIWGGVHASILPDNTLASPMADIVVRGEGEITLVELVNRLYKGEPLDGVLGLSFKKDNVVINNPDRPYMNVDELPIDLPYELLPLEKYPYYKNMAAFPLQSGRGCPHYCTFCYNVYFNKRMTRLKSSARVLEEIQYLIKKFKIKKLDISAADDNFFVNKKRTEEIIDGLLKLDPPLKWTAFCRFDYFAKYEQSFVNSIAKSGCQLVSFGGESGSEKILEAIKKDIKLEDMYITSEKMSKTNMLQITSFMTGFPGETEEDFKSTTDVIDKISQINPNTHINGIFVYTPYPGTPLYDMAVEKYGYTPPQTLEEWGNLRIYDDAGSPWISPKRKKLLSVLSILTRMPFNVEKYDLPDLGNPIYNFLYRILARDARLRWKHRFFAFPLEWWILKKFLKFKRGYI
ncbi:MAG: radical SAM protein [bacterium]